MGSVVKLKASSSTEDMRQRFEAFVRRGCRADEATNFLARSRGGEYVMATTKAAWVAWQAAIADIIDLYKADTGR